MGWYDYYTYVSVGEKKAKAEKKLSQLRKKDPNICPVVIEGKKIAKSWWGIAWCKNLESYADYSNRIERGRSYVKNGFVLDLQIQEGLVKAKVYGSSLYNVTIKIDKLREQNKERVIAAIGRKVDSIESLVNGKFPNEFGEIFLTQRNGLFPSPSEIHLNCDCPDWADMCKHSAAVLYGIGARLDADPMLFFQLRGIDVSEFIKKSIDEKMQQMLKNAGAKTQRVLDNADISSLFGI